MALGARTITQKLTVSPSAPSVVDGNGYSIPYPVTIAAVPGGGGTLKVEYQVAADGTWQLWPAGTAGVVSSTTTMKLNGPVNALRFTAAAAAGVVEIGQ